MQSSLLNSLWKVFGAQVGSLSLVKLFKVTELELLKKKTCFMMDVKAHFKGQCPEEAKDVVNKMSDRVWANSVEAFCMYCVGPQI